MINTNHRAAAGFAAALLIAASVTLTSTAAIADPVTDAAGAQACSGASNVLVVITSEDGSTLAACVANPTSGTDALDKAGVTITLDSSGMICALNNQPDPCPATFNGKYWQYYEASEADAASGNWTYATAGSDDTKPQPGWAEGWCYGDTCQPIMPSLAPDATIAPGDSATLSAPSNGLSVGWIISIAVAMVIIAAIVVVVVRRRQSGPIGSHAG